MKNLYFVLYLNGEDDLLLLRPTVVYFFNRLSYILLSISPLLKAGFFLSRKLSHKYTTHRMSSKEATKEVEADEVIAADAKKDAVKGTKRPAEVSSFFFLICFYII